MPNGCLLDTNARAQESVVSVSTKDSFGGYYLSSGFTLFSFCFSTDDLLLTLLNT